MISIDTETNATDFFHGAKPFFVTTCNSQGEQCYWEAIVDPLTREPMWHGEDIREIGEYISSESEWIFHHSKFDIRALEVIGVFLPEDYWSRVQDSLLAGHLLGSNQPHNLTDMVIQYLGKDILPLEEALHKITEKCRRYVRSKLPTWRIAKSGLWEMPSIKGSTWKLDTWLPKRLALELAKEDSNYLDENHPYNTVLTEYANMDSAVTIALWPVLREQMERRGLYKIYREILKVPSVLYGMESRGVPYSNKRLEELKLEYEQDRERTARICVNIARSKGYELELPKGSVNNSLRKFCFDVLNLDKVYNKKGKTASPTLDAKTAIPHYLATLPSNSKGLAFVKALASNRSRSSALTFLAAYQRFGLPVDVLGEHPRELGDYYLLHPSINQTGTSTLRMSSSNPNSQNVKKSPDDCSWCNGKGCEECSGKGVSVRSVRYCFGPLPGREWWRMDYENIELRIPAYRSGQPELIELFEHPNSPPYYGSTHLLIFSVLHPDKWKEYGKDCKSIYGSTWYQWTKNGNFAVQYGAIESSGTADTAYHVPGAQARIKSRFALQSALNDRMVKHAEEYGYVETIPDRTVDPDRGYPLLCTRTEHGRILPTVPLSYHVQGTAMWCTIKAMIRCQEYLTKLTKVTHKPHYMTLQVHDEIVFDFPLAITERDKDENRAKAKELKRLMELSGDDIGVPLTVSVSLHTESWSEGVSL